MSTNDPSTPTTATLAVEGMTCGACVRHVGEALAADPALVDHAVDLAGKRVNVTFDPRATSVEAIAAILTDAGYPARPA